MSEKGQKPITDNTPTSPPVILLLGTIADTTWRMFLPIIGLTIAGIYADNHLPTKPWLTIAGVVLGSIIAVLLIKQQLKSVQQL